MMHEWHSGEKTGQKDIEERLHAYYGPALPEQPLSSSSWQRVHSHLGRKPANVKVRTTKRRYLPPWFRLHYRGRQPLPPYIQESLFRVASEARTSPPAVRCTLKSRIRVPILHVSWLRGRPIRLILPAHAEQPFASSELDVLIASGLARYENVRRPSYVLVRLLLTIAFPLLLVGMAAGLFRWHNLPFIALTLSVVLCGLYAATFWLLGLQARAMARRADILVVQWIGRERACQGLHALAARSHAPSHRRWNDLSLAERIQRICSTHVALEEERYTLAR